VQAEQRAKKRLVVMALLAVIMAAEASNAPAENLATLESFDAIGDTVARSAALFTEAGKVLTHARCVNCHPAGDRPRQGDVRRLHQPPVARGNDGFGLPAMRCPICHQAANFEPGRVPGNQVWHLAPIEMAWEGKTVGEICAQIKDPARNGGRSLDEIVHHIGTDHLVGWAWAPGAGRQPAPGTQSEAGALLDAWVNTGAVCPH
jgi:cytochrome c5